MSDCASRSRRTAEDNMHRLDVGGHIDFTEENTAVKNKVLLRPPNEERDPLTHGYVDEHYGRHLWCIMER